MIDPLPRRPNHYLKDSSFLVSIFQFRFLFETFFDTFFDRSLDRSENRSEIETEEVALKKRSPPSTGVKFPEKSLGHNEIST